MSQHRPIIYLGGPLNDRTIAQAGSWRERWAEHLDTLGFDTLDPFESKEALKKAGVNGTDLDMQAIELGLVTAGEIVSSSLRMVDASDIVVLNLLDLKRDGIVSIGTPIELVFATMFQAVRGRDPKHTIVVANDVRSSFFSLAHGVVSSEEMLFEYLAELKLLR